MNNKKKLNQVGLPVIFIILILFSFLIAMFSELREKNIPVKTITLKFDTVVDNSLNLKFDSMESSIKAKIGQVYKINFFIENQDFKEIYGKAIYEVKPSFFKEYFVEIDCFCYKQQTLLPGEKSKYSITFYVDKNIFKNLKFKDSFDFNIIYTFLNTKKN